MGIELPPSPYRPLGSPLLLGPSDGDDEQPLLWAGDEKHVFYSSAKRSTTRRRIWWASFGGALILFTLAGTSLVASGGQEYLATGVQQVTSAVTATASTVGDALVSTASSVGEAASGIASKVTQAVNEAGHTVADSAYTLKGLALAAIGTILPNGYILDDSTARIDTESEKTLTELDMEVCGISPCHFLVAGWIREQNSKAQLHMTQVGELARRLERVLVLPNVEGGVYSTCYDHQFDLYHDIEAISEKLGVHSILFGDFERYTQRRAAITGGVMTAELVYVTGHSHERFSTKLDTEGQLDMGCQKEAELDFSKYVPVSLASHDWKKPEERLGFGQYLASTIDSPDFIKQISKTGNASLPDAYHVFWLGSMEVFPESHRGDDMSANMLPFNPRWNRLADEIAETISPAIALHWRQEAVLAYPDIPDFVACAKAAREKLDAFEGELKTVYFLTDYPINGTIHSGSYFRELEHNDEYRKAAEDGIAELYAWPGFTESKSDSGLVPRLLTLDALELRVPMANGTTVVVGDLDAGLLGILDKAVAERAEEYLVGEPHFCGRFSSFSAMVVAERRRRISKPDSRLKHDVLYFPKKGLSAY